MATTEEPMTDERFSPEERAAWDGYMAAAMCAPEYISNDKCVEWATEMLYCRRELFGIRPDEAANNCSGDPSSSPPRPDFAGEPEPITNSVLRDCYLNYATSSNEPDSVMISITNPRNMATKSLLITDARKLRAILEIVRS